MEERLYCLTCDSTSAVTSWTSETRALCAAALALTRALRAATMSSLRATACGETCVVVSGIVNEPGTGTRRRDRSRPRVSRGSETRVDGAVARESTRADAKGDGGKRNDGRRDARGCHDSVNVSGRTSGDAPWRAGKLLACRRAATGGAARGLPA